MSLNTGTTKKAGFVALWKANWNSGSPTSVVHYAANYVAGFIGTCATVPPPIGSLSRVPRVSRISFKPSMPDRNTSIFVARTYLHVLYLYSYSRVSEVLFPDAYRHG